MAYLKTILTIQDCKKSWVLGIIDLQQGKHSSNHHTGVEAKEQIVGIQFQVSQTILFRDIWREYEEPNVKPSSRSLILQGDAIHHPASDTSEIMMTKITHRADQYPPNGHWEREVLWEWNLFCIFKESRSPPKVKLKFP